MPEVIIKVKRCHKLNTIFQIGIAGVALQGKTLTLRAHTDHSYARSTQGKRKRCPLLNRYSSIRCITDLSYDNGPVQYNPSTPPDLQNIGLMDVVCSHCHVALQEKALTLHGHTEHDHSYAQSTQGKRCPLLLFMNMNRYSSIRCTL